MTSEMLVSNHHTTWHKKPENNDFYLHCHENLISYKSINDNTN
jgi:hypothetical protein